MQKQSYEILSFCIAIKRYKISSYLKKQPKHQIAKQLQISPNTFSKFLKLAIEQGFITEHPKGYRVIKLSTIIRTLFKDQGIFFGKHEILKGESYNYKEILNEIFALLVCDNVIARQEREINKKKLHLLFEAAHQKDTDKRAKRLWYGLDPKLREKVTKEVLKKRGRNNGEFSDEVITSVRHLAGMLGISLYRANKVLNGSKQVFKRKMKVLWIIGCNAYNYDYARALYPRATVIPCVQAGKIKVCFGSTLWKAV